MSAQDRAERLRELLAEVQAVAEDLDDTKAPSLPDFGLTRMSDELRDLADSLVCPLHPLLTWEEVADRWLGQPQRSQAWVRARIDDGTLPWPIWTSLNGVGPLWSHIDLLESSKPKRPQVPPCVPVRFADTSPHVQDQLRQEFDHRLAAIEQMLTAVKKTVTTGMGYPGVALPMLIDWSGLCTRVLRSKALLGDGTRWRLQADGIIPRPKSGGLWETAEVIQHLREHRRARSVTLLVKMAPKRKRKLTGATAARSAR